MGNREPWKRKVSVEFSGLANVRDFVTAILFAVGFVAAAFVIAFVAFG